jgi:hypothetical protein
MFSRGIKPLKCRIQLKSISNPRQLYIPTQKLREHCWFTQPGIVRRSREKSSRSIVMPETTISVSITKTSIRDSMRRSRRSQQNQQSFALSQKATLHLGLQFSHLIKRSQTWNALLSGCIPVFWEKYSKLPMPFNSRLPWDDIVLRLRWEEGEPNFVDTLKKIYDEDKELIKRKMANIRKYRSLFQYSLNPMYPAENGWTMKEAMSIAETDDAFTMILKELLVSYMLRMNQ